jgi:hypothetical protein
MVRFLLDHEASVSATTKVCIVTNIMVCTAAIITKKRTFENGIINSFY